MYDLAIYGEVFSKRLRKAWVYVKDRKIAAVSQERRGPARLIVQLGSDELLLPAATDLHVHLRDWHQASKETVASGTMSALAGGVTTVAEMPNTDPRITSAEMISKRIDLLRKKSYVDFAVHAGVPDEAEAILKFKEAGAFAVKFYPQDLSRFQELAGLIGDQGLRTVVHAEEASMIGTEVEEEAEPRAVERLLRELRVGTGLRFAHLSTSSAVGAIAAKNSPRLTTEVAPHHLFMTEAVAESRIGKANVVRPPLRSAANAAKMRGFLRRGRFDFYATDHAPHTLAEKHSAGPSPGFPGLEFAFPLILTKTEDVALSCRVFCENPALYLGTRKGFITAGYLADMVVMKRSTSTVDPSRFISKGRVTPFEGERLGYSVTKVVKNGEIVYDGGKMRRPSVGLATGTGE